MTDKEIDSITLELAADDGSIERIQLDRGIGVIRMIFKKGDRDFSFYVTPSFIVHAIITSEGFTALCRDVRTLETFTIEQKVKEGLQLK